ncbi:hypothetical protein BH10ACT2_BH10ACT2_23540 [soil metagenome]
MTVEPPTWLRRALPVVVVLPILFAIARALHNDWFPIGDDALLYLRAGDVFTSHNPLLGSWTSASLSVGEHMNNPGPIYSDMVAPFAKLFSPGPGAAIGVGAINILTVFGISAAGRRVGGWSLQRWVLLATAALTWSMGSELLIDIWQSHAMMLPYLLVLILLVGVASGQTNCLPWAIGVVSLVVQTHISHAYILAMLCPVAVISYALTRRGRPHRPMRQVIGSRPAVAVYVTTAVLWALPLYEQFFGTGKGNLGRLLSNAGGGSLQVGGRAALGISANLFTLPNWWSRFSFNSAAPITRVTGTPEAPQLHIGGLPSLALAVGSLALLVALLAALFVYNRRQQRFVQANACLVALTAVVASCLAVSRLTVGAVGFSSHHVRFLWPTAVFVHVVVGWTLIEWLAHRWHADRLVAWATIAATAVFAVAAVPYYAQPAGPVAFYSSMPTLRRVLPELGKLRDLQPVVYDTSNLQLFEPYSSTVMMQLRELGIEFRVEDEGMVRQLGEKRRADGSEPARIFQLQGAPAILERSGACLIVIASDLDATTEQRTSGLAEQLATEIMDGSISFDSAVVGGAEQEDGGASLLAAATSGDRWAARSIVYNGYLGRWYAAGGVIGDRDLTESLALITHYVDTAYAIYRVQAAPCPTPAR